MKRDFQPQECSTGSHMGCVFRDEQYRVRQLPMRQLGVNTETRTCSLLTSWTKCLTVGVKGEGGSNGKETYKITNRECLLTTSRGRATMPQWKSLCVTRKKGDELGEKLFEFQQTLTTSKLVSNRLPSRSASQRKQ